MASLPEPVLALVGALGQLPGIGPRSAERLALHLVQSETGQVKQLAEALVTATERIELCNTCGALTETQPCALCTDDRRGLDNFLWDIIFVKVDHHGNKLFGII